MEEGNQEKEPKGDSKSLDHLPESVRNAILRAKKLKGNSLENTLQDTKEASQENKVIHRRFYSPLVRSTAKENGISQTELDGILGSGRDGRVTKKDVLSYLEGGRVAAASLKEAATLIPSAEAYDELSIMVESGGTVEQFINEYIDTDDAHNMGIILKGFKKVSEILGDTLSGNFKEDTNPDDLRKKYAACINLIDILQTKYYSKSDVLSESDLSWLEEISRRVVAMPIDKAQTKSPELTAKMYYREYMSKDAEIPQKERIQIGIERLNSLKGIENYIRRFGVNAQKFHYKASLIGAEKYLEAQTYFGKKGLRILESEIEIYVENTKSDKNDLDSIIIRKYSLERLEFDLEKGEKKAEAVEIIDEFYLRFTKDGSYTLQLSDIEYILNFELFETDIVRTKNLIDLWDSDELVNKKWAELKNKWSAVSNKDDFKLQFRYRTVFYIEVVRSFSSGITKKGSEILFCFQEYTLYRAKVSLDPITGNWDQEDDREDIDEFYEDNGVQFTYDKLQEVFELTEIDHVDYTGWTYDTDTLKDEYSEEQSLLDWKKLKDSFTELSSRDQIEFDED